MTYIKLHGVSFGYTPEKTVLRKIHLTLATGIWAIAGPNGAGKTTLLRLIAGEIEPGQGSVQISSGTSLTFLSRRSDSESQGRQCSSGEAKMQQLQRALQQESEILLLDEPEAHLDAANRAWLKRHMRAKQRLVLMVSHDADLLNMATRILHVEGQAVRTFDAGYESYREMLAHEQQMHHAAAARAVRVAKAGERHMQQTIERQERRSRNAARRAPDAGIPKVALGLMKRNAEKTAGKIKARNQRRRLELREKITAARQQPAHRPDLRFDLGGAQALRSQVCLEVESLQLFTEHGQSLWQGALNFAARAGDRIRLAGPNGAGKSLLMQHLCGLTPLRSQGRFSRSAHEVLFLGSLPAGHFRFLLQEPDSILQLAKDRWPTIAEGEIRRKLGAFGYRADRVFAQPTTLSAGEYMRLQIFLATAAEHYPGFCFFDEAEIGLDAETREAAADFLRRFAGIVLIASHDECFVRQVAPTQEVRLMRA